MDIEEAKQFWEQELKPLFSEKCLEFRVQTLHDLVRYVNLDNAATTPPFKKVSELVNTFFDSYGSIHRGAGQKSKMSTHLYEESRPIIRKFIGASSNNYVLFTKNTTEAINHAAALWTSRPGKVLVSDIEHSSNLLPWLKGGEIVQYTTEDHPRPKRGIIDTGDIKNAFKMHQDIKLVAITGASNLTGFQPKIEWIAEIAHKNGAKILVDACQLIPHQFVDVSLDNTPEHIDFIAFSGHKMYAPYGSGVLVGPKEFFDASPPYQIGGGNLAYITSQLEMKRLPNVQAHDPGTANAVGAIAIAKAAQIIKRIGYKDIKSYEHALSHYFQEQIKKVGSFHQYSMPDSNIITFDLNTFDSRLVAEILASEYGIGVRAGSFCNYNLMRKLKGVTEEDDVRIASEIGQGIKKNIPSAVRASIGLQNNVEDIDRFVSALHEVYEKGANHYLDIYEQNPLNGEWEFRR